MSLENLMKSLALGLQASHMTADEVEVYKAILAVVQRFESRSISELTAAMRRVRPKVTKASAARPALTSSVEDFCVRLEKAKLDPEETQRVLQEMDVLLKADVVEIAKRRGVRTNSKTGKKAALEAIASLSGRAARDRGLADRIRRGA